MDGDLEGRYLDEIAFLRREIDYYRKLLSTIKALLTKNSSKFS